MKEEEINKCQRCGDFLNEVGECDTCEEIKPYLAGKVELSKEDEEALAKIKFPWDRPKRPKIVCICGSSRFVDIAAVKAWEFEKQGWIAIGMHLLPEWYAKGVEHHMAEHENVAEILKELHLRKIDLVDLVYVINKDKYIGEQTTEEVQYARRLGKKIQYMEAGAWASVDNEFTIQGFEPEGGVRQQFDRYASMIVEAAGITMSPPERKTDADCVAYAISQIVKERDALRSESERIKEEVELHRNGKFDDSWQRQCVENRRLEAENARLREALASACESGLRLGEHCKLNPTAYVNDIKRALTILD